ncbi:MAG: thioredoxin family protein [Anaerolineae bacterium]|jgi:thiol-disulfide isomerase/thioredoxin
MKRILAAIAVLLVLIVVTSACSGDTSDPAGFEGGPGMLYFYSPECPVCQGMKPIMDDLENEYGNEFKFVRVNVDTNRGKERARAHGLIGQPAYLIFDSSDEEMRRLMGAHTRSTLAQAIEQAQHGE